jgi:hypothetical protein
MLEPESALISCPNAQEMAATCSNILAQLSPDVARQLRGVRNEYLIAYGWEGVFERFNGRTVAQVIAEYEEPTHPPIVASGELGGVRYTLYEAPEGKGERAENGGRESN